jgi:hypothetical protein
MGRVARKCPSASPSCDRGFAVVHSGMISNHDETKKDLQARGTHFAVAMISANEPGKISCVRTKKSPSFLGPIPEQSHRETIS